VRARAGCCAYRTFFAARRPLKTTCAAPVSLEASLFLPSRFCVVRANPGCARANASRSARPVFLCGCWFRCRLAAPLPPRPPARVCRAGPLSTRAPLGIINKFCTRSGLSATFLATNTQKPGTVRTYRHEKLCFRTRARAPALPPWAEPPPSPSPFPCFPSRRPRLLLAAAHPFASTKTSSAFGPRLPVEEGAMHLQ
jgi:hypothetical protein